MLTKNKVRRETIFITAFYNEVMNLGIMNELEKFVTVKTAERYLRTGDSNAFIADAAYLIYHHDKGLMHPDIFPRRQPLPDSLHALLGENGPGGAGKMDLNIVTQPFNIKYVVDKHFRQL